MMTRKTTKVDPDRTRSAVSNGTKPLDGADGRSKQARRLRDLIHDFSEELGGGDLSPVEAMLVRNAAMSAVKSEEQQAKMAAGEDVTDEDAVRVGNMCSRAARDLAAAKAKRSGAKPFSIVEHVASLSGAEPDAADDDEIEEVEFIMPPDDEPHYRPVDEPVKVVQTPSAPEPIADLQEGHRPEPVKPIGPVTVTYDARPGVEPGKTLHQIVAALKARSIALIKFTTPAVSHSDCPVDLMIRDAGLLASKATWHVRGVDL
jgi:hypothetical protein